MQTMGFIKARLYVILVSLTVLAGLSLTTLIHNGPAPLLYSHLFFSWFFGAALGWGFELYLFESHYCEPFRKLHFGAIILIKAAIISIIVCLVSVLEQVVNHDSFPLAVLTEARLYKVLGLVFLVFAGLNAMVQIVRIIGGRVLINFILGKYHKPIQEERIFLFLDLVDSTALAERLGDVGTQDLISHFFFDLNAPIVQHRGEIHRYIGDQIVVTWTLSNPQNIQNAIYCCFAIQALVKKKAAAYKKHFGAVPIFRMGLHGGPVVVSECGDRKQEIVYFGDTVNTAARIEQQCKVLDSPFLISAELLHKTMLPDTVRTESKGCVKLRGRSIETELFSLVCTD